MFRCKAHKRLLEGKSCKLSETDHQNASEKLQLLNCISQKRQHLLHTVQQRRVMLFALKAWCLLPFDFIFLQKKGVTYCPLFEYQLTFPIFIGLRSPRWTLHEVKWISIGSKFLLRVVRALTFSQSNLWLDFWSDRCFIALLCRKALLRFRADVWMPSWILSK